MFLDPEHARGLLPVYDAALAELRSFHDRAVEPLIERLEIRRAAAMTRGRPGRNGMYLHTSNGRAAHGR